MRPFDGTNSTAPFPVIPDRLQAALGGAELRLRAFGTTLEDLSVDFSGGSDPYVVTEVLACCTVLQDGRRPDRDFLWDLPVGTRTEALLVLAAMSGALELPVVLRCKNDACGEAMEVEFTFDELVGAARDAAKDELITIPLEGQQVTLRRPTGADQVAWRRMQPTDERSGTLAVLRSLVVEGNVDELREGWIDRIEEAMADRDPLTAFTVTVECPECGQTQDHAVDLARLALDKLRQAQARLIESVHRLAKHYHWTEEQVMAIPAWRRARYLALLAREEAI